MAIIYDTGGQGITMWAPETEPGVAVAGTNVLPVEGGAADADIDPGLSPVEIAAGSPFVTVCYVQRAGQGTWQASYPLYPSLGQDFIAAQGFSASGIAAPTSFTLTVSTKAGAFQFPGCRCTRARFTSDARNGPMVAFNGIVTQPPIPIAPLAVPAIQGETPFTHKNMQDMTLIGGTITAHDLRSIDCDVALDHAADRGNGYVFPNIVAFEAARVTGSVVGFLSSVNIAEFQAMLDSVEGPLTFKWDNGTNAVALAVLLARYGRTRPQRPRRGLDLLTLEFGAFSPTLTNLLDYQLT